MIHDHKPPLDEAFLIHFGKSGMRWGVRHVRPDEAERKERFGPRAKKYSKANVKESLSDGAAVAASTVRTSGSKKLSVIAVSAAATLGSQWVKNRSDPLALDMPVDHIQRMLNLEAELEFENTQ